VQGVAGERGGERILSMTDSNVVDFPSPKRPTGKERAEQDRSDRAERISRLREVLGENPKMGGEDQIIVARALHDLLERIERRYGVAKAKILREAGIGGEGDSTKHLSQYAIPRDLTREELNRRSARLRKKPGPYVKLAEAAASFADDLDEGDTLLEVFGQASFWHQGVREAASDFVDLADRLRLVADGISRKYELTKFFRKVERAQAWPAPTPDSVQRDAEKDALIGDEVAIAFYSWGDLPSSVGWPIELHQLTWLTENEMDGGNLPPYPSIILGSRKVGSPFPISIVRPLTKAKKQIQSGAKTPVTAQGWPAVELRLCIAPIGKEQSATPVLRIHLCAYIVMSSGDGALTHRWAPLSSGQVTIANYELTIERVPKLPPPFTPGDAERHLSQWGGPSILFLPICGAVCEDWFRFSAFEDLYNPRDWPLPERALGHSLCGSDPTPAFSEFGGDTLAGIVDAALCNPNAGLDRLLEQQVKRLQNAFEASRKAARDLRDQHWEIVKERWKKTDENS
jgi:hypothetical protein